MEPHLSHSESLNAGVALRQAPSIQSSVQPCQTKTSVCIVWRSRSVDKGWRTSAKPCRADMPAARATAASSTAQGGVSLEFDGHQTTCCQPSNTCRLGHGGRQHLAALLLAVASMSSAIQPLRHAGAEFNQAVDIRMSGRNETTERQHTLAEMKNHLAQ